MGYMTIFMRHAAGDQVKLKDFVFLGSTGMSLAIGSHSTVLPHQATCLIETTMAPLICMLERWFAYQEIYNDNDNEI